MFFKYTHSIDTDLIYIKCENVVDFHHTTLGIIKGFDKIESGPWPKHILLQVSDAYRHNVTDSERTVLIISYL